VTEADDREAINEPANPLGMEGIEFIEYATARPQALGQVLETLGFHPIARHRSREVLLYRQGGINVIVNAHGGGAGQGGTLDDKPVIAAVALRVRDAAAAYGRALERGAWAVPIRVEVMELNIPAVHGPGGSRIYFVDRHREFSIYDVDFVPIPGVDPHPPALAGLHFFGIVQYIGNGRTEDWTDFYGELFGFQALLVGCRLRHPAQGPHPAQPVPGGLGLLPAADRARTGHSGGGRHRMLPARGPGNGRCAGHRGRAAHPRRGFCGVGPRAFGRPRRAHADPPGRRVVRVGPPRSWVITMNPLQGNIDDFGMDTISLAGPLEAKLQAVRAAGFGQIMLSARDIVGHPDGLDAAVQAVRASGLRVTGFQVLRDFEGLSGHLHDYKVDIAKSMLEMCAALGSKILLVCSSTSVHATQDLDAIAKDLRKLAMLAIPLGIKVAYEGLSWGRTINEFTTAWEVVSRADVPNLGLGLDSFHLFATQTPLDDLELLDPEKIFLVQLADFMWQEIRSVEERITTARHFRVFPGEGVHSEALAELVRRLHALGYRGDYSFEVFNDDYQQIPLPVVAQRARRSALWLGEDVQRRSVPLPNQMRLRAASGR
jgi:sugar phosphate isomerase/epimerase